MKKIAVLVGVVLTALAASACCILPLVLGVASAGTLGLSAALTPYRPYLIGVTLLLLCGAFCAAYRPAKASTCATEGDCAPDGRGPPRQGHAMGRHRVHFGDYSLSPGRRQARQGAGVCYASGSRDSRRPDSHILGGQDGLRGVQRADRGRAPEDAWCV